MAQVLVVDDDQGTRETFAQVLHLNGCDVRTAATADEGLQLSSLPTDLVICDIRLPDFDGLSLLRRIRDRGIDVPIVLMTGFGSATMAFQAGRLGAAAYLEKPIDHDALVDAVKEFARRSRVASAHTRQALQLIHDRYADPRFDIHAAAASCGVSREHLARRLRDDTGRTFTELLRQKRMEEAKRLLSSTNLPIKSIYYSIGVTHASAFDHAFKRIMGMSPREYRIRTYHS